MKRLLGILRMIFINRADVYGTARDKKIWQEKALLTDEVLSGHVMGKNPVGVYSINPENMTRWACVDIDVDDFGLAIEYKIHCSSCGLPVHIERSKRRGYHVWAFIDRPVQAYKVRAVFGRILTEMDMQDTELFPKQDELPPNGYGNFVWTPLFGYFRKNGLARRGRTVFVNDSNMPYADQVEFLSSAALVTEGRIDELLGETGPRIIQARQHSIIARSTIAGQADGQDKDNDFMLAPPCIRQILNEGVTEGLRNEAAFRIGIFLHRAGIPAEFGWIMLLHWNLRNRPPLSEEELDKVFRQGYSGQYSSYGCHNLAEYCDVDCPIYRYREQHIQA